LYTIVEKRQLNETVTLMTIHAPLIAAKALPGQFIILRIDEEGERIPLTVADYDRKAGEVTIIFQHVGRTTKLLATLEVGDGLLDFVGPLGRASELDGIQKAVVIGGGVGCAIAYPQAKYLHEAGAHVDVIAGFRSRDIVILEEEMRAHASSLTIATDDGSYGRHGFVTDVLREKLQEENYELAVAIGPVPMMRAVCNLTKEFGLRTVVSLNPIMIDGTGMCGGCRVTVGGQMKFACVDGPDFDGHQVDFDELMKRNSFYREQEAHDAQHICRLTGGRG
jgi:ferredoxin--NADP+ reductase